MVYGELNDNYTTAAVNINRNTGVKNCRHQSRHCEIKPNCDGCSERSSGWCSLISRGTVKIKRLEVAGG